MLEFETVEDLVEYMFDNLAHHELVSAVAGRELSVEIMREMLTYQDTVLTVCHIDAHGYGREYLVSLYDDEDCRRMDVEPIYDDTQGTCAGTDGYVLFHEDVNCKAYIDLKSNDFTQDLTCDWFVIRTS